MLYKLNVLFTQYGYNEFSCTRVSDSVLAVSVFMGILRLPRSVNGGYMYTGFTRVNLPNKLAQLLEGV